MNNNGRKDQNLKMLFIILFFWLSGMIIAWQTNRMTELMIVSVLVIVFIVIIARDGLMSAEILEKPLYTELLINLPYDKAYDQCLNSLATINGDVDSSNKDWGRIVAIPVGIPVLARYFPAFGGPNFIWDRISFDIIKESKTKTLVKIRHNLEKGSTFKIQKEEEKMKKIENYLSQWEVKPIERNSK